MICLEQGWTKQQYKEQEQSFIDDLVMIMSIRSAKSSTPKGELLT